MSSLDKFYGNFERGPAKAGKRMPVEEFAKAGELLAGTGQGQTILQHKLQTFGISEKGAGDLAAGHAAQAPNDTIRLQTSLRPKPRDQVKQKTDYSGGTFSDLYVPKVKQPKGTATGR